MKTTGAGGSRGISRREEAAKSVLIIFGVLEDLSMVQYTLTMPPGVGVHKGAEKEINSPMHLTGRNM